MSLHAFAFGPSSAFVLHRLHRWLCGQAATLRILKICVAGDAPPAVEQSAERIRVACRIAACFPPRGERCFARRLRQIAIRTREALATITLSSSACPMIRLFSQSGSTRPLSRKGGFYIFGFGASARRHRIYRERPQSLLHSSAIAAAPYETRSSL